MAGPGDVAGAWAALGRQLAASRRAAGLSQERLAPLSGYSRSTVANAETGRQRVPRDFWERCDGALGTGSALARGFDELAAMRRQEHLREAAAARQARLVLGVPVADSGVLGAGAGGRADLRRVDLPPGEGAQRPVVGVGLDPPALLVGQIRQRGPTPPTR